MVWTGIPLPNVNKGWFLLAFAFALVLAGFFFLGSEQIFLNIYNSIFWIFFGLFWGAIIFFIFQWIWRNIKP